VPAQLEATRFGCRSLQLQRLGGEGSGRNRLRYLDTVALVNTCQLSVGGIVVTVGPWQQRDFCGGRAVGGHAFEERCCPPDLEAVSIVLVLGQFKRASSS